MFETSSLLIFITATLAFLIKPGPVVLYVIGLSVRQGRMAGFVSILGIHLASVVHVIFAALGLSAVLMTSALVFSVIKYMGAAYLIYLGLRTLMSKAQVADIQNTQVMSYPKIFGQGFIINFLNPETALFFLSFLPQFVNPSRGSAAMQIIILGVIFVAMAIVSDNLYAFVAGTSRNILSGNLGVVQAQKYFSGIIYIILGTMAALSSNIHTN